MATQDNLPIMVSRIGIIGAGVSGLAIAKQLSHYNPIVFEATDSIGGVLSFNHQHVIMNSVISLGLKGKVLNILLMLRFWNT
jgi:protoporphyrinogen oxidase